MPEYLKDQTPDIIRILSSFLPSASLTFNYSVKSIISYSLGINHRQIIKDTKVTCLQILHIIAAIYKTLRTLINTTQKST